MAEKQTPTPKPKSAQIREDRLKAALKANLARRKAQSRVRAGVESGNNNKPGNSGQDKDT